MVEDLTSMPRKELSFDELVNIGLSGSGIGDTSNNFVPVRFSLAEPELWPNVKPIKTYENYLKDKYERRPDLAAAIIEKADKSFVGAYNGAVEKINRIIGDGVTNEVQAGEARAACQEASKVVSDFCATLSSVRR